MTRYKNEIVWVRIFNSDGEEQYLITSNEFRSLYYLYEKDGDKWQKTAKGKTPLAFEDKIEFEKGVVKNHQVLRKRKK